MYSRKPRVVSNMHVFAACEIDFANKQLVCPSFSWNTTLLETSLGESYILMIYRYLHA